MLWEDLLYATLKEDEFRNVLKEVLSKLRITTRTLSKVSGVSESALYKFLVGERVDLRLSTCRSIIRAIMKLEGYRKPEELFVAIIAARPTLDALNVKSIKVGDKEFQVREYAASSIEEVIMAAVRAQREGARAIVCAPIVSTTVEKIVKVPVAACPAPLCREPLLRAVKIAATKAL